MARVFTVFGMFAFPEITLYPKHIQLHSRFHPNHRQEPASMFQGPKHPKAMCVPGKLRGSAGMGMDFELLDSLPRSMFLEWFSGLPYQLFRGRWTVLQLHEALRVPYAVIGTSHCKSSMLARSGKWGNLHALCFDFCDSNQSMQPQVLIETSPSSICT